MPLSGKLYKPVPLLLLLFLLLAISACSIRRELPGATGHVQDQAPPAPLESPLLAHADLLTAASPDKNFVTLLDVGSEALLARIHLIRSARDSIGIQTIIWVNDQAGRLVMYELVQAARRGVKVQVLVDHLASEQHVEIATFLASVHPNLEVKMYNPVSGLTGRPKAEPSFLDKLFALVFKFTRFNQRMHNKIFIVDGMIGITGGRNYQDAYFDHAPGMNYKDRDILVIGTVAREMKASFQAYWDFEHSVRLAEFTDVQRLKKRGKVKIWGTRESFRIDDLFEKVDRAANRPDLISRLFIDPMLGVEFAYFVADDPWKVERGFLTDNGRSRVTHELARLVAEAKRTVTIQTPYLVLSAPAIDLFRDLREEYPEIDIRISTNSLAATDSWHVYALSYKQKQTYLQTLGFRIYEFKPVPGDMHAFAPNLARSGVADPILPEQQEATATEKAADEDDEVQVPAPERAREEQPYLCLHAKSLVIDDEVAFIGSYNLDPRSENINTEAGLFIRDKQFAGLLQEKIRLDMAPQNSWFVAKKKIPLGIGHLNAVFVKLSNILPLVDIWPFRYSASFELIEGKEGVDVDHSDFYDNYRDVGSFPAVDGDNAGKEIGARGTKAFLSFVKPLL
jgi:phosphatidylserine/phosphatidylglycerophosphate/cardiolipin synthase-like enzyme